MTLYGTGLLGVDSVAIGGVTHVATARSDQELVVSKVQDATPTGLIEAVVTRGTERASANVAIGRLLLSETNSLPDTDEFVELFLYDTSNAQRLAGVQGYVIVAFDGSALVTGAADVDALTNSNGFLRAGVPGVAVPDVAFGAMLANDHGAVALYQGESASFPVGSTVQQRGLIDAVVFDADTEDVPEPSEDLLARFFVQPESRVFVDEDFGDDSQYYSVQRCIPSHVGRLDGREWSLGGPPTPGAFNGCY